MILKNDEVVVTTGREKGKKGKILSFVSGRERVLIEKVNLIKRHVRPSQKMPQGGVVEREASIHISNVMNFCLKCKKGVRLGVKVLDGGKKQRTCRKCDGVIGK